MSAYELPPRPGPYRITNVLRKDTVIEVPYYNQDRAVSRKWQDKPNQHWIIQYSGRGYKIRNREYGVYLFACSSKEGSVAGAGNTPTVWTLIRTETGFLIQYEEEDRAINLHHASGEDDNVLLLWKSAHCPEQRRWKFQHISDDTGEEVAETVKDEVCRLKNELALKDQQLADKDRVLAAQAVALHQMGSPECIASRMTDIYSKLDELKKIEREIRTMMSDFGTEHEAS